MMRIIRATVVGVLIAMATAAGLPAAARANSYGANGLIAFSRGANVYTMRADGAAVRLLVKNAASPAWSPGGTQIVFTRAGSIYRARADGSHLVSLGRGTNPQWAPDGLRIVFAAAHWQLWTMRSNGSDRRLLRDLGGGTSGGEQEGLHASWSPNGRLIAFSQLFLGPDTERWYSQLYTIRPDGTGLTQLTDNVPSPDVGFDPYEPDWSPAGSSLTFTQEQDTPDGECVDSVVGTIRADGGDMRYLEASYGGSVGATPPPSWAPAGGQVVFASYPSFCYFDNETASPSDLYRIDAATQTLTQLTNTPNLSETSPSWQPRCTITGTPGPDTLVGTSGPDLICAGAGNDAILGRGGHDVIFGGSGADKIYGGGGGDVLVGGSGADRLYGGTGPDLLNATDGVTGNDTLDGQGAGDVCIADSGDRKGGGCP